MNVITTVQNLIERRLLAKRRVLDCWYEIFDVEGMLTPSADGGDQNVTSHATWNARRGRLTFRFSMYCGQIV
jgi:hypothetical protein